MNPESDFDAEVAWWARLLKARMPSAVEQLAALIDPNGEAATRVALWEEARQELQKAEYSALEKRSRSYCYDKIGYGRAW